MTHDIRLTRDWHDGYRLSVETVSRRGIDAWQRFGSFAFEHPLGRRETKAAHDAVIRDFIAHEGLIAVGDEE